MNTNTDNTDNTNPDTTDDTTAATATGITNERFIELLNLCVDARLTPDETAELDTALLASPARRRIYEQYWRIQKACEQLFDPARSQHQAPTTPALLRALAEAERKIQRARDDARPAGIPALRQFRQLFTWRRGLFAFGGLAALGAATGIALMLHTRAPAPDASAGNTTATALANSQTQTPQTAPALAAPATAPVITNIQDAPRRFHFPAVTTFTFTGDIAPDDSAIAWTKDLQLRPIRKVDTDDADDTGENPALVAKPQTSATVPPLPAAPAPDGTTGADEADEMSAFQFHK